MVVQPPDGRACVRIVGVDCFHYDVGYVHGEYVMSGGRAAASQMGTLVRLRTDEGVAGWGEITPLGATYLPVFANGVRAAIQFMAPHLLGLDPRNISAVRRVMDSVLMGHDYAKSPIDIACWDIMGRACGQPVSALLGGVLQEDFPLYEAVPLGSPESMADHCRTRSVAGITRFQLKVGNDPLEDAARARAVVEVVGEDTVVVADANGGWSLLDARRAMAAMTDLRVYVEQPCRTTEDCALAARDSALPLVLDESVVTVLDVFTAKHQAGASSINVKISRVGGLTQAARIRDLMQELNLTVSLEDTWGGDVITAAVSHLAASTRPESMLNVSFFNDWTNGHVAGYAPRSVDGRGSAPTGPGLGIEVDAGALGDPLFTVT
jgi:L-alanine-DL-glutamate epimerase-like enolase superfamily enzyme